METSHIKCLIVRVECDNFILISYMAYYYGQETVFFNGFLLGARSSLALNYELLIWLTNKNTIMETSHIYKVITFHSY